MRKKKNKTRKHSQITNFSKLPLQAFPNSLSTSLAISISPISFNPLRNTLTTYSSVVHVSPQPLLRSIPQILTVDSFLLASTNPLTTLNSPRSLPHLTQLSPSSKSSIKRSMSSKHLFLDSAKMTSAYKLRSIWPGYSDRRVERT